ncbi:hypothetical protein O6H91_21G054300 [Diphasiastrum complanatum]|uniref:Uncharacterized protein n=1 Tax=Diphasiastrum complanatum TaxID=34168 RepID=A0ACC2AKQ9_DIPCM|nr:hypothetical protein O6H91_21G054300 [Diphasiastrum complanatum]
MMPCSQTWCSSFAWRSINIKTSSSTAGIRLSTTRTGFGLNVGVFLLRNCQWLLDILDAWATMGPD